MKHIRVLTKRPMAHVAVRMRVSLRDLLRTAAAREEISQSDFLRKAVEDRARRILIDAQTKGER